MNSKLFRVALAQQGTNQIQLASTLGISPAALSYWVKGYYRPPFETQQKIAEHLHIRREELFPEEKCKSETL